jgi:FKBP-type peptidyl-prolyl cis-trans isomerase SlyD
MAPEKVQQDAVVSLQYRLTVEDEVVEESEDDDPLMYLHGHNNIIPGLESALEGLQVGDEKTVKVKPRDAYGDYDPNSVEEVDRADLPDSISPTVGMVLAVTDEETGGQVLAEIIEVNDDTIVVDYNHPMAGQELTFDITITALRDATGEELSHGHVHSHGHHH